ncbi:putative membrane protein [Burkholderia cenocepacia]|uniref:Membrane protein n=1 Tax=Burkholderia cenocepacia TaxID=95486 RepID=A0AAN0RNH9_9BURK|nr:putative membrane protein [Burkholderia cenocepacia]
MELLLAVLVLLVVLIDSDAVQPVLLACAFYSVYQFWEAIASKGARPIATVFWLYHAFFLLIPGWLQVINNFYPWARVATDADMEYALCAVTLGLWSFSTAYQLRGRRVADAIVAAKSVTATRINALKIMLALGGSIPAMALIAIVGPASFLQERSALGEMIYQSDELALVYNAAKFSVFGVAIALAAYVENDRKSRSVVKRKRYLPVLSMFSLFCAAVATFVNNPLSSPRFHFLGMLLGALLVLRPLRRRSTRIILWTTAPVFLYTLFPVVKNLGEAMSQQGDFLPDIGAYLIGGVDFDGLQQLANIARMTEGLGISWGSNFLSAIFFWVPRSLWAGKATITGALAADYVGYEYSNLSAPLIGEALSGLGMLGVVVFFTALGWLAARYDARYNASLTQRRLGLDRLLVGTVAGFLFILLRGSLNAVFPQIGVSLLVVIALAPRLTGPGGALVQRFRRKTSVESVTNHAPLKGTA